MWKKIPGFENYEASDTGEIRSTVYPYNQAPKKPRIDKRGYCRVNINKKGKRQTLYVHRLIASTFIENPENKRTVNHIDGNKQNNHVSNLEWCTYRENNDHGFRTGLLLFYYENTKRKRERESKMV